MVEFLTDQHFLSALAAAIGPLAFFAAPTEEIERLLFDEDSQGVDKLVETGPVNEDYGIPEAA